MPKSAPTKSSTMSAQHVRSSSYFHLFPYSDHHPDRLPVPQNNKTNLSISLAIDFWGPVSNFGIPLAAVMDTQKDPEMYVSLLLPGNILPTYPPIYLSSTGSDKARKIRSTTNSLSSPVSPEP